MDKPVVEKVRESKILDAFKVKWKGVTGKFTGNALLAYKFQYNAHVPSSRYKGAVYPITTDKEQLGDQRVDNASFWVFEPKEENRLRKLTNLLLPLSNNALVQPLHVAYNSQIDKTVVCCTAFDMDFIDWVSKEVQVPVDGFISDDAKDVISSLLLLSEVIWEKGLICDGLDDPSSYVMKGSRVQLLPFRIREKQEGDTKMTQRNQLADLIDNLNASWIDIDVAQFTEALRNPAASLEFLLDHPVLLQSDRKMTWFLSFNKNTNLSTPKINEYNKLGFNNWTGLIPATEVVLQKVLTYKEGDPNNIVIMYRNTPVDAHRFCRNTCSHYLRHWRKLVRNSVNTKAQADMVDKKLKRYLRGFISMVYALPLSQGWTADPEEVED